MKRNRLSSHKLKGLPPGTLIYIGNFPDQTATLDLLEYNQEKVAKKNGIKVQQISVADPKKLVKWYDLIGISDIQFVEQVGSVLHLHALAMEDIVNTNQRPKIDDLGNHLMVGIKMMYFDEEDLRTEHISLILGENYVFSFQEVVGDVFASIRQRILENKGKIRMKNADYLLYALLDNIVDHYYSILEKLGDNLDGLEDQLLENFDEKLLSEIQRNRNTILRVRRSVYPLREVIGQLSKSESKLIDSNNEKYFRDLYDHTIQIIESIETFKEMVSSLKDIYMSGISNRMNNIMKVLTIIATIFIPLTFVAGIYGMNFDNMPELHWDYGYFAVWGLMILLFIFMLYFFRKKDWI